jgi:hypothetical protein
MEAQFEKEFKAFSLDNPWYYFDQAVLAFYATNMTLIKIIYNVLLEIEEDADLQIAEAFTNFNGFDDVLSCLNFLDSINFDYNKSGTFKGDATHNYIVHWACEYRRLDLLRELSSRNVSFDVLDNSGQGCIEIYCLGHSPGSLSEDFSDGLKFLFNIGLEPRPDLLKYIKQYNDSEIHENVLALL